MLSLSLCFCCDFMTQFSGRKRRHGPVHKILVLIASVSSDGSGESAYAQTHQSLCSLHVQFKTCVKQPLSEKPKIGFQDQLSLIAGQKYCRMLQGEHSAILSTFIKLPFVIKIFVLPIFEWPLKTGFTVQCMQMKAQTKI